MGFRLPEVVNSAWLPLGTVAVVVVAAAAAFCVTWTVSALAVYRSLDAARAVSGAKDWKHEAPP